MSSDIQALIYGFFKLVINLGIAQHSKEYCFKPIIDANHYFQNKDGLWIFTKTWNPPQETPLKGVIFFSHGFGEHVSRRSYHLLAERLNKSGFIVHGMDHQGHGRSNGERVHVEQFTDYAEDFIQFIQLKYKDHPDLPHFLLGHSMGSLVAALTCLAMLRRKMDIIKGVVLVGLALTIDPKINTIFNRTAAWIASSILPKFAVRGKIDSNAISRNPDVIKACASDELNYHGVFKARHSHETIKTISHIEQNLSQFTLPVIILHGSSDTVCRVDGAHRFYNKCGSRDKRLVILEGMYHEPFEDEENESFFREIEGFLLRRVHELEEKDHVVMDMEGQSEERRVEKIIFPEDQQQQNQHEKYQIYQIYQQHIPETETRNQPHHNIQEKTKPKEENEAEIQSQPQPESSQSIEENEPQSQLLQNHRENETDLQPSQSQPSSSSQAQIQEENEEKIQPQPQSQPESSQPQIQEEIQSPPQIQPQSQPESSQPQSQLNHQELEEPNEDENQPDENLNQQAKKNKKSKKSGKK